MLILTPNRRLAAFSQTQYNQQQLAANNPCWEMVEIYSIEAWLLELWQLSLDNNYSLYRPILTKTQQQLLFERIIQQNSATSELLRIKETAQNALKAWGFLQQWQVDRDKLAAYAKFAPDIAVFCSWLQTYCQWLDKNEYYDSHMIVDHLIVASDLFHQKLPTTICLRGFNELTPQYATFFAKLKTYNINIIEDQLTTESAKVIRAGFSNVTTELQSAATWAMESLQVKPEQNIAVVIPELERLRAQVHNIFGAILPKAWLNISAPLALSSYTLIQTALLILQLSKYTVNFSDISILLRSPYVGNFMQESSLRASLDRKLRELVEEKLTWHTLLKFLQDEDIVFKQYTTDFCEKLDKVRGNHAAAYWATVMQDLLYCWQWPGDRALNVEELDLLSCWRELLDQYCQLSLIIGEHSFAQALQVLQRLANDTPFLAAETGLTKLHVLGLLESEGLVFDQLWVCGMTRDSWPATANPNPFIPLELQRQYDLPHSSAQRELTVTKKYTANLQKGGKQQVIFSYPMYIDDHSVAPSNLIMHLSEENIALNIANKHSMPLALEYLQDCTTPTLQSNYVINGINTLKLQAQCPFKANAEARLLAKPLVIPQLILTPAERGSLVHEVLESFWQECGSYAQLVAYLPDQLESLLNEIIKQILSAWLSKRPLTLTSNYAALEAQRLYTLIINWLAYEATRLPFTVYKLEQKFAIKIDTLQFNIRIDRIDRIVPDQYIVIDYKTGAVNTSSWFSEPIYEPQLPIYATYIPEQIAAVAFAHLQAQEVKFSGVGGQDDLLPNVKTIDDWEATKSKWRTILENMARSFSAGHSAVAPYSQQVCNSCNLQSLCRIYEQ